MNFYQRKLAGVGICLAFLLIFSFSSAAQKPARYDVLTGDELTKIVPASFYFAGQSAETQIRNTAAARIGKDRHIIAGMVDVSGYSTEISGKYEGFFITDSPILIGGKPLGTGAYGFGFATDGTIKIFDLSSKEILRAKTINDAEMKRPRPLMMSADAKGVRFYKGKNYVTIAPR